MTALQRQPTTNRANIVNELYTDAKIEALNTALVEHGISSEQIIAILPEAGQTMVRPTPAQFRVLYRAI